MKITFRESAHDTLYIEVSVNGHAIGDINRAWRETDTGDMINYGLQFVPDQPHAWILPQMEWHTLDIKVVQASLEAHLNHWVNIVAENKSL